MQFSVLSSQFSVLSSQFSVLSSQFSVLRIRSNLTAPWLPLLTTWNWQLFLSTIGRGLSDTRSQPAVGRADTPGLPPLGPRAGAGGRPGAARAGDRRRLAGGARRGTRDRGPGQR